MSDVAMVELSHGGPMPQFGFGVFKVPPGDTEAVVTSALDAGYRSIDTAAAYGNEAGVGRAISAYDIDRADVFVTTKLANSDQGHDEALAAFDASLDQLGVGYVDLYLIHWPVPGLDRYVETWRALEEILDSGRARAIGVSNFEPHHLDRVLDAGSVVPAVNQIELHPRFSQDALRAYHREHGIVTEAWSPLARGGVLDHPVVTGIAETHGATPAQVVLAWHLALGNVVIPKSVTPARIVENIEAVAVSLTEREVDAISALDDGHRMGPRPDDFGNP
jgi:2,5-diketo-D-gluconate reductase A